MSSVPDILYSLTSPWNSKHIEPLAERLTEAAELYLRRYKVSPNVALISGGDWEDAQQLTQEGRKTYSTKLSNGKLARIRLLPSPWQGQGRDIYCGRQ